MTRLGGRRRANPMAWLWAILVLALLAAGAWLFWQARRPAANADVGPGLGQLAPNLAGTSLTGIPVDLWKARGKPAVVNFWSANSLSRNKASQAEARLLADVQARLPEKVNVFGVLNRETAVAKAADVAGQYGLLYPTLNDPDLKLAQAYAVESVPTTFFLDRAGVVRLVQRGAMNRSALQTGLKAIGVSGF